MSSSLWPARRRLSPVLAAFLPLAAVAGCAGAPAPRSPRRVDSLSVESGGSLVDAITRVARAAALAGERWRAEAAAKEASRVSIVLIDQHGGTLHLEVGAGGELDNADRAELQHFFRCRRTGREHPIAPGLVGKLADLADHFAGRPIEIVSAYRHPPHASRGSRHRHGRAIDIRVVGIPARTVRDYLWTRYDDEVGVGFYRQQQFVHLDHRPGHPATAWTQRRQHSDYRYHPGWSRAARRQALLKRQDRQGSGKS